MSATPPADYGDLRAMFINCTLTRSPEPSHTETLIGVSRQIMEAQGVEVEVLRAIDHDIATGIYPDMTEQGADSDEWPQIYPRILASDIVVLAGPIWLGDNSSVMKRVIERLYAQSGDTNEQGQGVFYGRVGGCLITGNEDGLKHCSMNVLYSLQHVGFTIPPDADAGWMGDAGPGASYGDDGAGFDNDFTNQNTTFATWNQLHMARMLRDAGGIPAYGNQPERWADGERFGFVGPEQ